MSEHTTACLNCGQRIPNNVNQCPSCGKRIIDDMPFRIVARKADRIAQDIASLPPNYWASCVLSLLGSVIRYSKKAGHLPKVEINFLREVMNRIPELMKQRISKEIVIGVKQDTRPLINESSSETL